MIQDPAVKKLFDEYAKAYSALDIEKNAQFFADTFITAGPDGASARTRDELLKSAGAAVEFYRNAGQESAAILMADEIPISDRYSLVKAHWGANFRKTGKRLVEFDVSYVVQKTGPEPKIVLFISHQDELKIMQKLDLVPA